MIPEWKIFHQYVPRSYNWESWQRIRNEKKAYSARLIFTDSIGWGYQIFDGNTMVINQIHIPSIQGNIGFKSRESAQLAANFILYKLSNGVFPPTVDEKELDSLGVLWWFCSSWAFNKAFFRLFQALRRREGFNFLLCTHSNPLNFHSVLLVQTF